MYYRKEQKIMKARKFTFHLGIIIFLIAACGIDNEGWWIVACLGGLGLAYASLMGLTKKEQAYVIGVESKNKAKDYRF